jgi:hypothetical protein
MWCESEKMKRWKAYAKGKRVKGCEERIEKGRHSRKAEEQRNEKRRG